MKVTKREKCFSILAGIFIFALCVLFFITLISAIIVLSEPLAGLTFKGQLTVLASIFYVLGLLVCFMLYFFNIHERSQIGVLRAFVSTDAISYQALKRSIVVTVFSILLTIVGCFILLGFTSMKAAMLLYVGNVVVRNSVYVSFGINVVLLLMAAVAGANATDKYQETCDRVQKWTLLLTSVEFIATKIAKEAKKDSFYSEDFKAKMHEKISLLALYKEFPEDEGIIAVYANSVFDDILFGRKWL